MSSRVWLVTGATGGLGRAVVREVLSRGERVVAATRTPQRLQPPAAEHRDQLIVLKVDITDPDQVRHALGKAINGFGRLDVVVNNAGYALPGPLEELDGSALRAQFEVNVFGPVHVLQAALPHLRSAGRGHILQISSIAGQTAAAGMSAYTGSKHALEGISVSLAAELAPLGIHVTIVEPGAARTDFRRQWAGQLPSQALIDDYAPVRQGLEHTAAGEGGQPGDPRRIAEALFTITGLEHPPLRLPLGGDAVAAIRKARATQLEDLTTYEALSLSTDNRTGA